MISQIFLILFVTTLSVYSASFKGDVSFTKDEKDSHTKHLDKVVIVARSYLTDTWDDHTEFHKRNGFSKYYGDRSKLLNTRLKRRAELSKIGVAAGRETELKPTSCIGLTLNALKVGFLAPKDPHLVSAWKKIEGFTRENGVDGTALIHALQKLGWKTYYWNPYPSKSKLWDVQEKKWQSKGWHAYRYQNVMKRNRYYFNSVDNKSLLVGFKKSPPKQFQDFPLFVGVAHTGYHVFPGFNGEIIEAHSTRRLSSKDNLERSRFNPFAKGGGPRWSNTEKYRSGLIAVPPVN